MQKVSANVSDADFDFVKKNRDDKSCSITFLLRNAIWERRQREGDVLYETNKELREKVDNWMKLSYSMRDFLEKHGMIDKWMEHRERYGALDDAREKK